MKTIIATCLATASLALFASGAQAQNITASHPEGMMSFFKDNGIPATLTKDNTGDPLIEIEQGDYTSDLYFYGCDDGTNCDAFQFFSGYATEGKIAIATINEWNEQYRFGRAYLTDDGASRVEHDVFTGEIGIAPSDFEAILDTWKSTMKRFEKTIDW